MTSIMINKKHFIFSLLNAITISLNVYSYSNIKAKEGNAPNILRQIISDENKFDLIISNEQEVTPLKNTNQDGPLDELGQNNSDIDRIETKEDTLAVINDPEDRKKKGLPPIIPQSVVHDESLNQNCWTKVNAKQHFKILNALDDNFASVRMKYHEAAESDDFDQEMLTMMLKSRGVAERAVHSAAGDPSFIPAGINLGGYSMMRLHDSILFFHRMKLRNNTHFRVNYLHNDLYNMVLTANFSLNDLHILGAYERATTKDDPSELFYTPTYGEVEFLLRNVQYNLDGRYRLLRNKLTIELVVSDIITSDILMTYQNNESNKSITLQRKNIDEFLDRLKTNLDKWVKDYFNDYLVYFGIAGDKANADLLQYDQKKTVTLNEYADEVLERIKKRLKVLKFNAVRVPKFTITTVHGMQFKLTNGVLRGLDTIHRRSFVTSKKEDKLRKIDSIVGFSSLKATYQYEAVFITGVPPINGILVVSADELIGHMGMRMTENPETLDLLFDSIQQIKPESLTLEGPANRIMGNFKNILERHVFTYICNAITHNVRMLHSITKCEPLLISYFVSEEQFFSQENVSKLDESDNELNSKTEKPIKVTKQGFKTESHNNRNSDEDTATKIHQNIEQQEISSDNGHLIDYKSNLKDDDNSDEHKSAKEGIDINIQIESQNNSANNNYEEIEQEDQNYKEDNDETKAENNLTNEGDNIKDQAIDDDVDGNDSGTNLTPFINNSDYGEALSTSLEHED